MTTSFVACYEAQCAEDKADATRQSVEALVERLRDELARTGEPVDVQDFIAPYFPHDIEAGQLVEKAFRARLLRGRLCVRSVHFEGYVSGVAANMPLVWH